MNYVYLIFGIIVISGCTAQNEKFIEGAATVADIDILIMESFPVQINVNAKGDHNDDCTRISKQIMNKGENSFFIELKTFCEAPLVNFMGFLIFL